jgi:non-specific serine/threonine protein kinase
MSADVTAPSGLTSSGTGAPALSSNALPIGTHVHEFEITRVIGEGGFSVVYLAFDHTLHRSIALKEYIPSALAGRRGDNTVAVRSAQHQQTFEAGLRSFINEARLLAQFDHPALVKVYRFWEANGTAYMAMPYYEGRTLKDILREHPEQASEEWLKQLFAPILDALELLHRHRCYHRDIAPDNIQILDSQAPVLLDFGAARRTIGDMTQAFTVILKPGYAPIEQYADEADLKQGPWTDVYALAAVLYGAVMRKPPPTAVARVIKDPLEPLAKRLPAGYSPQFLTGIDRGLAVRPEDRPQSIGEIRELLGIQGHGRGHAETHFQAVVTTARGLEPVAGIPVPVATPTDSGMRNSDGSALAVEKERTVLVPGLRRPTQSPATHPPSDDSSAPNTALRRPGDWRSTATRAPCSP